ncbi:MAG: hypothetical protein AM326_04315 [Candidatus Thorarchaeota archaeon SMTZ-45]|nr:MAG: hypothetical protein AM326_04315 [Candidatus Thorarchaeota archaeon SMTZ-45]
MIVMISVFIQTDPSFILEWSGIPGIGLSSGRSIPCMAVAVVVIVPRRATIRNNPIIILRIFFSLFT